MVKICGCFRLWWFSKHWLCRDTSAKRLPYFRQYSAALGRVAASSWQQVGCVDPQKVAAGCRLSQCLASYVQAVRLHPLGTALPFARCSFPVLHPVAGGLHRRCCSSLGQLLCFRSSLPSAVMILLSLLFFLKDKKRRPAHQVPGCRYL